MSYYVPQRGDYYGRGDPGFLSGLWKGIKTVGGALLGVGQKYPVATSVGTGVAVGVGADLAFPGGTPLGFAGAGTGGGAMPMQNGCCPAGYHPDKRTGTKCVRNRRMNVANARALRRSMRRVQGFEKLAKRTISFTRRVRIKK